MSKWLSTPIILAGFFVCSLDVTAEGLADQRNERDDVQQMQTSDHASSNSSYMSNEPGEGHMRSARLTYKAGDALREYPELTAQQRKYLVFGSN